MNALESEGNLDNLQRFGMSAVNTYATELAD
jgi:hypothetical protein